jgi:hypothetical protein
MESRLHGSGISPRSTSLVDGELMAQCNNLELQKEPPAERGDEEVHQCNAECPHGIFVWMGLLGTKMAGRPSMRKRHEAVTAERSEIVV